MTGEAAGADVVVAQHFPTKLQAVIEEHGYLPQQVFNLDETGLFWKRMPSRTFLSIREKRAPGFKASKDRLTLLLGGNASGDHKIKPLMVYHSENPRALKGLSKQELPVVWLSNKKAWITGAVFEPYFSNELRHELHAYCKEINVPFKILLLLDNAPGHPPSIADADENISVLFLPPNTTSLIQPMDQGVIATFKSYYLRRTFMQLVEGTDRDENSVTQFWKNFTIKKAIENIGYAWAEVTESCMKGVWKKIWPQVADSLDFDPELELSSSKHEVVGMAKSVGFEDVDEANVDELLQSHAVELTTEDLLELEKEMSGEDEDPQIAEPIKQLSTRQLTDFFNHIDNAINMIKENDPNKDRSAKVAREIQNSIACYKELYREKKNSSSQLSLYHFFKKDNNPQLAVPGSSREPEIVNPDSPDPVISSSD